jgi:intein/homing endonuclease
MVQKIKGIISRLTLSTWAYCYDENTEVLTKEGFKKFSELSYNDEIATLNPETDEIEYQHPIAIHKFYYKGKMVHIEGKSIDLFVTPEHKLYCANFYRERKGKNEGYNFIEAINLLQSFKYQKYKFKRTAKWKGVKTEYFELPSYEKNWMNRVFKEDKRLIPIVDWLKLFAWYIAEGDTSTYGKVRIANTKEENLQEILELCKNLGFNASIYENSTKRLEKAGIRIYSVQLWKYLSQFGKATEKFIPNWIKMLPPDKLQVFLETITKGDGHKDSRNWKYYTSSKRLADDIQEIAIKAGYTASVSETVDTRYGRNVHMYIVHIDRKMKDVTLTQKPSLIDYDGFVYDVTVPKHHIILVRRNGKICWSSNSNYHKPEEMTDYHKSMKTSQYDILQTQRKIIENWVARQIPPEEANPVRIRQYQNAVLQAVAWRAKRHKWGYGGWKAMDDATFKGWWLQYWKGQGLNESTLESLYTRMEVWLKRLQEEKVSLGEKVKTTRQRLALLF